MPGPGALCRSIRGTQACTDLTAVRGARGRDSNSLQDVPADGEAPASLDEGRYALYTFTSNFDLF
jgi:hypothetical protein